MRRASRTYPTPLDLPTFGPYTAMVDSSDPALASGESARMLRNVYVPSGIPGQRVEGRPGYRISADSSTGTAGTPLGSVGARRGQLVAQWTEDDGTSHTIAIVGGRFYEFDWSTRTWSEPVTAANFTTSSITLSTTATCYAVALGNSLVISDGVNTPFKWDGGTGAGSVVELTNCPVLYGQPVVYYAKLVGIKASDRKTFVWSEENDPTTGYDAGGYNNAWDFVQTGTDPLTALAATNEALYVFRGRQIARVQGAMGPDFQTSGTRTDVDAQIGTTSTPLVTQRGVVFVDADARPWILPLSGGRLAPIWHSAKESVLTVPRTSLENAQVVEWPILGAVLVALPSSSSTYPTFALAFDAEDGRCRGYFDGFTAQRMGTVLDGDGVPRIMFLDGDGYAYDVALPTESQWVDERVVGGAATDTAIAHEVQAHPMGVDPSDDKWWYALEIISGAYTSTLTLDGTTPYGSMEAVEYTVSSNGTGSILGVGTLGSFILSSSTGSEVRSWVGVNTHGRWFAPRLRHAVSGERFAFSAWKPEAYRTRTGATVA